MKGQLYFEVGRYCDALGCLKFCLDGFDEKNTTGNSILLEILSNMGAVYFKMRAYDDAKGIYFKVIKLLEQSNGKYEESAKSWMALADIYFEEKRYQEALSCYQKTVAILSDPRYQEDEMMLHIMKRKGLCYLEVKDFENSVKTLSEVLELMMKSPADDVFRDVSKLRFELGLGMYWLGNRKDALENWKVALDTDVNRSDCNDDAYLKLECFDKFLELGKAFEFGAN